MGLLANSILITSPTDIYITITAEGTWDYKPGDDRAVSLSVSHPSNQYTPRGTEEDFNIFKGYTVVKITLPIQVGTLDGQGLLLLPPQFHSTIGRDLHLIMGEIKLPPKELVELSIILMVKIPDSGVRTVHIKDGEVLGYLYTGAPHPEISECAAPKSASIKSKLIGSYK